MSTLLRTSRLIELCTPSISYDRQVQAACEAFDQQMYSIMDDTGVVVMIPNIMGINDSNLIDILAWQFHVDFYDATRDLEFRKNLVQQSISWHRRKGTVALVQEVLDTYWPGGATILEWFDYMSPFPPNYPTAPGWHDRYRFRVYVDELIIKPEDEAAVLELIDRYKPISRWCEGVYRAESSDCFIGWCGMLLRFIYHESDAPDFVFKAHGYLMSGPSAAAPAVSSAPFTVQLRVGAVVEGPVVVTPSDSGGGGTFTPASVTLTNTERSATFTYTPASEGTKQIKVTNDGDLDDPSPISLVSTTPRYTLTGPASGDVGTASTPFTVASTDVHAGSVTVTPHDGGKGGTFTPATVQLTAAAPSATFTYTPTASGNVPISTTNDGGLTDPAALSYNAIPFSPVNVAGLKLWLKASAITPVPADGTPITLLPDSSGQANHAAPAPTGFVYYANGLRAFNANRERIMAMPAADRENIELHLMGKPILQAYAGLRMALTTALSGAPPWTIIAVLYNQIYSAIGSIGDSAAQGTRGVYIRAPSSAATIIGINDGTYTHETAGVATANQWGIYTAVVRAVGDVDFYFNGNLVSHTSGVLPLGATVFNSVGMYNGVDPLSGYLTEIEFFNNAVSASDLTKLHNAIKAEYGLTL